ncbi:WecB/TagA/CpsF family glycosyltransferase [Streptosporangium vulgare]|uniref:WecB/TagA/CpsF family glycosyltransferase n=1 Tax=Streptosporangium vulgare TaxID=46190 RepID=UPI003CD06BCD
MTLRHGAWIVPSTPDRAVERPQALAPYGPPVASLLTGHAVKRPPVSPRHGLVLAPSAAGQAVERPHTTVRHGLPVVPLPPGRAAEPPQVVTRRDSPVMSSPVTRPVAPAARDVAAPIRPLTDHRSATTGHDPVPGLPAVAGRAGTPVARRGATSGVPRRRPRPDKATRRRLRRRVHVAGVAIDPMTESEVVDHVVAALKRGEGGHLVTPNVDISRTVARDPRARRFVERADLAVADGMPLVWAARLLGTPLPGRVTGADLIWSLSEAAAFYRHPVYLLGGPPGTAARAARELVNRHPKLVIAGVGAPPYGFEDDPESYARVRDDVIAAAPRLVFVGLGFPPAGAAHHLAPPGPAGHLVRRLRFGDRLRRGHRPAGAGVDAPRRPGVGLPADAGAGQARPPLPGRRPAVRAPAPHGLPRTRSLLLRPSRP